MPDVVKNKVKFGLKNCVWWPVTETTDSSTGAVTTTYGTKHTLPGAVSLAQDAQGDRTVFRADDSDFYVTSANGGYSGTLNVAQIPDDLEQYCFDIKRDINGVAVEDDKSGTTVHYFALAFQFAADQKAIRHLLPKCSITKPSITSETTPEGNTPNVQSDSVTLTSVPRPDDGLAHLKADPLTDPEVYDAWFTTPYMPVWEEPEPDPEQNPDP